MDSQKTKLLPFEEKKLCDNVQNRNVIISVFQTISSLIIIIAIFLPWLQIRGASLQSVYFLCADHISTDSMSYSYMIGDYLQRFEITTSYTSLFVQNGGLVRCVPENIYYFKKFCDQINIGAVLRPYRYYLAHNQTGACQLEYYGYDEKSIHPNNQLFKLFYIFPYNMTHDMIRVYNETVDFKTWNFLTDGEFVTFIDAFSSNVNIKEDRKEPFWNTGLAVFGSQNESRVFTILYPIRGRRGSIKDRLIMLEKVNKLKNNTKKNDFEFNAIKNHKTNNSRKMNDFHFNYTSMNKAPNPKCIDKLNEFFLFYEKKIMNHLFCFNMNKVWFAKNIEEAKNKSKKVLNTTATNDYQDEDDYTIPFTNVGSSFFTESLYIILKQKKHDVSNHYMITDDMYNVLIENDMGALYPKYFDDGNVSVFPHINDINNSIWTPVAKEIIEVPIDVPLLVNVSASVQYMIMKRIVNTRSSYSFYIIMLFDINQKILEIYSSLTNVFIICLALLSIVFFLIRLVTFTVVSNRNKKLKNKQKAIVSNNFYDKETRMVNNINPYKSELTKSIDILRMIQLMNSDDSKLNNSIDEAIKEMTKSNDDLFNVQINDETKASSCSFCQYLIDKEHDLSVLKNKNDKYKKMKEKENFKAKKILSYYLNCSNDDEDKKSKNHKNVHLGLKSRNNQLFYIWNIRINSILNRKLDKVFLFSNPHRFLIRKYMKYIQKQNLFFPEIYPDMLISFIISFTQRNFTAYHCKIKSFQLFKKLIKHNNQFWLKSKLDMFILFLASILRNSRITNAVDIVESFSSFVSYQNDYFSNLLRVLIDETNNVFKMEIYGQLYHRIQSPDFSVSNNVKDMILFMKALLSFADFAPYLTEYEQNEKCLNEINKMIFTKEESENQRFVSYFHFEMTKNVVFPWLILMNSLSPIIEINNSIIKNVKFWYKQTKK